MGLMHVASSGPPQVAFQDLSAYTLLNSTVNPSLGLGDQALALQSSSVSPGR